MIKKIHRFFVNLHPISFILVMVILSYLITRPFILLLPEIQSNPSQNEPIYLQILSVLIIAPIVETLIFQVFLFWILRCIPWIREHDLLIILIAALMFGLYHPFGITYIICITVTGILYNYAYLIYYKKNEKAYVTVSGFWIVFWIHEIDNIISLTIQNLYF